MKISKSKQELARIISENGGWREGAESAAQCVGGEVSFWHDTATKQRGEDWCGIYLGACYDIRLTGVKLPNWHQTILSREEYFHLHPAPDADGWIEWKGGECPVSDDSIIDVKFKSGHVGVGLSPLPGGGAGRESWMVINGSHDIIAYRLHRPEQLKPEFCESVTRSIPAPSDKPTIEQLASDYQAKLDIATLAQEEADAHRCGAEVALSKLEIAVKELGFRIELVTAKQEPELVITDWRDLRVGDEIEVFNFECPEDESRRKQELMSGPCIVMQSEGGNVRIELKKKLPTNGSYWNATGVDACDFKFIRRP